MALVGTALRLAVKNAPKIIAAIGALSVFLKNHPDISTRARETLEGIPKRLTTVLQRHGDAAKIRGILGIIRDVAGELDAPATSGPRIDAGEWLAKADGIERRVRLAEAQPRAEQKKTLAGLLSEAEALLADFIQATADTKPSSPPKPPDAGAAGVLASIENGRLPLEPVPFAEVAVLAERLKVLRKGAAPATDRHDVVDVQLDAVVSGGSAHLAAVPVAAEHVHTEVRRHQASLSRAQRCGSRCLRSDRLGGLKTLAKLIEVPHKATRVGVTALRARVLDLCSHNSRSNGLTELLVLEQSALDAHETIPSHLRMLARTEVGRQPLDGGLIPVEQLQRSQARSDLRRIPRLVLEHAVTQEARQVEAVELPL